MNDDIVERKEFEKERDLNELADKVDRLTSAVETLYETLNGLLEALLKREDAMMEVIRRWRAAQPTSEIRNRFDGRVL